MKPTITDEVEQTEAQRRTAICKACQFYKPDFSLCGKCNCFIPAKTRLKASFGGKCPIGKW